jgi:hypothetical protein
MSKKDRHHHQEAWSSAKKACRLNARQVEMARALGMNPRKLPGLRPSPRQRWKLPVGRFLRRRFRLDTYGRHRGGHTLTTTRTTTTSRSEEAMSPVRRCPLASRCHLKLAL